RVFLGTPAAASVIFGVDSCRPLLARIIEVQRTEVCNFGLDADTAGLLVLLQYSSDEGYITAEVCWKLLEVSPHYVAPQDFLLQRQIQLLVGISRGQLTIIEGKKKAVHEEDPPEARGRKIIRHGHAVCHCRLYPNQIEHVRKVGISQTLFLFRFSLH